MEELRLEWVVSGGATSGYAAPSLVLAPPTHSLHTLHPSHLHTSGVQSVARPTKGEAGLNPPRTKRQRKENQAHRGPSPTPPSPPPVCGSLSLPRVSIKDSSKLKPSKVCASHL